MSVLARMGLALGVAACIPGCATSPPGTPSAGPRAAEARVVAADQARHGIAPGKSTKADVAAALGETLAIRFESGFEVWVYRLAPEGGAGARVAPGPAGRGAARATTGELVILFAPSGVVAKTRTRVPPAPA